MSSIEEKPTLTIVAGREGPTEGPHSNAARIAEVKARVQGIRKGKRGRRPGRFDPYNKKELLVQRRDDIEAKRAQAYADMETFLCEAVKGTIASNLFDCTNRELYDFAVNQVERMLQDLKKRYYALDFLA
jgi:hypothetical protein